jgi:hypothetical protein
MPRQLTGLQRRCGGSICHDTASRHGSASRKRWGVGAEARSRTCSTVRRRRSGQVARIQGGEAVLVIGGSFAIGSPGAGAAGDPRPARPSRASVEFDGDVRTRPRASRRCPASCVRGRARRRIGRQSCFARRRSSGRRGSSSRPRHPAATHPTVEERRSATRIRGGDQREVVRQGDARLRGRRAGQAGGEGRGDKRGARPHAGRVCREWTWPHPRGAVDVGITRRRATVLRRRSLLGGHAV